MPDISTSTPDILLFYELFYLNNLSSNIQRGSKSNTLQAERRLHKFKARSFEKYKQMVVQRLPVCENLEARNFFVLCHINPET